MKISETMAKALKQKNDLQKRLESYSKTSDFLLEAIMDCEINTDRLPGALLLEYNNKTKNPKCFIAMNTYEFFRDPEVLNYPNSTLCYNICLLAACFAYAYCLEENL